MAVEKWQRLLLLAMSIGLAPIALSYGSVPEKSLPWLFGIDASGVNTRQIFRAIMGLYFAFIGLWVAGALRPALRLPALWSLFVFTLGLAMGRLLSLAIDGWPHPILFAYMLAEFALAAASAWLIAAAPNRPYVTRS